LTIDPTCIERTCQRGPAQNELRNAYHLVDCLHDLQHLVVADLAIAINVVELEGPIQLVFHLPPRRHGQGTDELLEVYCAGVVGIEYSEDIVGELGRVPEREELPIDLLKLLSCEVPRRAVLEETCGHVTRISSVLNSHCANSPSESMKEEYYIGTGPI
jgi:hypothetical protein